jgi:PhzF family phenazine biosynthesis protein
MIDVFGSGPVSGNPLAVVHDAEGLNSDEMLSITRWLNLSETTFLVPPTSGRADYGVRIFTLRGELPFAGHPTLGTCHAWLQRGGSPRAEQIIQECEAGLVPLVKEDHLSFAAPPLIRSGTIDSDQIANVARVLGIDTTEVVAAEWVDNGPGWMGILLADHERLLSLQPDAARSTTHDPLDIGVVAPHRGSSKVDFEVRAFFSDDKGRLIEDPVTGSLNASLGQWLIGSGRAPSRYTAAQGTALGRRGRAHIFSDGNEVWVGGTTVTVVSGEFQH